MIILSNLLLAFASPAKAECIAVVTAGGGQSFWQKVINGAVQAGKELNIEIYARGAIDEANVTGQSKIINIAIKQGCRGLVLAPNSIQRKIDVTQLKNQGIPTVYIDRDVGGPRISVIKTENFSAGELAGKEMAKALGGNGKVVLMRVKAGVVSTTSRENGFIKGASNGGLEIIEDQFIGTMVGEARFKAYSILKDLEKFNGIFTPNEATTIGVLKALEKLKIEHKVIHIGFDAHKIIINSLKAGHIYGFIEQRPFQMGYQGVKTVYRAMHGKSINKIVDTGVIFVSKKNIEQAQLN
jgi:ribose transport system substrate-binding protein